MCKCSTFFEQIQGYFFLASLRSRRSLSDKKNMKTRPGSIWLMSVIGLLMGPSYLMYRLWLQSYDVQAAVGSLDPIHFVFALLTVPVAIGIFMVRPWGYFLYLSYSVSLVAYFLYEYFVSPLLYNYGLLLMAVVILGAISLLIQQHVTAPYFSPRLRWWERDSRYRVNLQADFIIDGDSRKAQLLDLSLSGCYAILDTRVSAGDVVNVEVRLMDYKVKTLARVIWENKDHPGAYGVMFTDLDRQTKKDLRQVIQYLSDSYAAGAPAVDQGVPHDSRPPQAI